MTERVAFGPSKVFALLAHSGTFTLQVGLAVLGIAFLVEGYSLWVALEECRAEAKKEQLSLWNYILEGSDAMNVAVLMEDGVAVRDRGHCPRKVVLESSWAAPVSLLPLFLIQLRVFWHSLAAPC